MDLISYLRENAATVLFYGEQHFLVVLFAIVLGSAISVVFAALVCTDEAAPQRWSLGWFLAAIREGALVVTAAALTVPSLALFVLLLPLFGLGAATTVTALTIYSLYTVLRNSVAGLSSVDAAVLESAKGLGMSRLRRLVHDGLDETITVTSTAATPVSTVV